MGSLLGCKRAGRGGKQVPLFSNLQAGEPGRTGEEDAAV